MLLWTGQHMLKQKAGRLPICVDMLYIHHWFSISHNMLITDLFTTIFATALIAIVRVKF